MNRKKGPDWQFIDYEHDGETFNAMYECSDGCVSARLFLKGMGVSGLIPSPPITRPGDDPIHTARMLFRDLAKSQGSNTA